MARGAWLQDSLTSFSAAVDVDLSEARRLGCDLFDITSIAPFFDVAKVRHLRDQVAPRARSIGAHMVELRDSRDALVGYAMRSNSAEQGDKTWLAHRKGRLDGTITDVTGGDLVAR